MAELVRRGVYLLGGREILEESPENREAIARRCPLGKEAARRATMAYGILAAHDASRGEGDLLRLNFDAMASHDITFVNIVQTAKVSGLEKFPLPYVLTNCHNSLCAVGGTINGDDPLFGLSAAQRYGGIYVPPHLAVIHSYVRETLAGGGKMILGSDSHTRYGALGTMGVGEGGGELVKQLLLQTCDAPRPRVIAVYLSGKPRPGVGPQDVALSLIEAVFKNGYVKNCVLEFVGEGIAGLPVDYRSGIDVMTTETTCWSSIWETDEKVRDFLTLHHRGHEYRKLEPGAAAWYEGLVRIDLSAVRPMIALPFHPSKALPIASFLENPGDMLRGVEREAAEIIGNPALRLCLTDKVDSRGRVRADQGIIAGCAGGTFDNIMAAEGILRGSETGTGDFSLSVYPGSQPVMLELAKNGAAAGLIAAGAVLRSAFCGPCFGAGDVPANNSLSIRHTTRNFPNREGSKPAQGQIAAAALMDARSIAATARNGGFLRSAEDFMDREDPVPYRYDDAPYRSRVYRGAGKPDPGAALRYGPNITDWPEMEALGEDILLKIVSFITDPVTTTDELIPSGDTSSFRSNPLGLAEYTLSRKDPAYLGRAKAVRAAAAAATGGFNGGAATGGFSGGAATGGFSGGGSSTGGGGGKDGALEGELAAVLERIRGLKGGGIGDGGDGAAPSEKAAPIKTACGGGGLGKIRLGSAIYARKPGDGSAREQAASCQRVLGGLANFAGEYATKRYRSNLINWGILPFTLEGEPPFKNGDYVFIPGIARAVREGAPSAAAYALSPEGGAALPFTLTMPELSPIEGEIVRDGCLINYNRRRLQERA
jgi:aconitate hydratase